MSGIEPGTPGDEQRTQNPNEAAPRAGVAGNQDPQTQEGRDGDAESRRESGGERMIDVEDDLARAQGAERDAAAENGDSEAQAERADRGADQDDNANAECPLCGYPMGEHTIDRSTPSAVLNCPGPIKPAPHSTEPLNEVGMVKRRPDSDGKS